MKNFLAFIAIVTLFSIASCSTKFNIAAPYKNITVIYGMLDQSDTAHYIRIEKAFLSNTKSAITMAQTWDSSYFGSLNVRIARINQLGGVYDTIHLTRVDLDLEGYPKQPGAFFTAPNYAYKFTNVLDPNYTYRLIVSNPVTGEVDSAETPVIVDTDPTIFNVSDIDDTGLNHAGLDFHSVIISNQDMLSFSGSYVAPVNFSFNGQTSPVAVSEFVIGFNWVDSNIQTHVKSYHSSNDDLGFQALSAQNIFTYNLNNIDMYSAVKSALGTAPANTIRLLGLCSLSAYMSTYDYSLYEQNALTQGTGLTGNNIEPSYTNIKGANVLGLFTSKGTRSGYINIDYTTVDSLIASPILTGANLQGTIY